MEKRQIDVVVLSDFHLGTFGCHAKEITAYLQSISPRLLVLNGDIIDIWQFSKHYFPSTHIAVINEILRLLSTGTRVIYITGNHDEVLRKYTDLHLGNLQLTDKLVIEIEGKMTWIFHGDAFDNTTRGGAKFWARLGSNGYAVLLGLNRVINSLMKILGKEPVSLSKKIMAQVNKSFIRINAFETLVAELAIEKKYHYVICSHIHQPAKRLIETPNGKIVYLNSGDWVDHLTALEYFDNDWHIYQHSDLQAQSGLTSFTRTEADVMTDEVSYYLHSLKIQPR